MSHFTVMVVGDDHKEALAPFHEFECTGENDQYVVDVDITGEAKSSYEENKDNCDGKSLAEFACDWFGLKAVEHDKKPDTEGEHKYGYVTVDEQGELVTAVNRTNPNAKWDWYQVGGRWQGMLMLKDEVESDDPNVANGSPSLLCADQEIKLGRVDSALKGQIDFKAMGDESSEALLKLFDYWVENLSEHEEGFQPWVNYQNRVVTKEITIEEARGQYHNQPLMKAKAELVKGLDRDDEYRHIMWKSPEDFFVGKGTIEERREKTRIVGTFQGVSTYAVLKDGNWYQRGEMGWWGMSTNEISESEWAQQFLTMLEEIPDDTRITIVDCHI